MQSPSLLTLKKPINWQLTLAGLLGCATVMALTLVTSQATSLLSSFLAYMLYILSFLVITLTNGVNQNPRSLSCFIFLQILATLILGWILHTPLIYILLVIIAGQLPFIFSSRYALVPMVAAHSSLVLVLFFSKENAISLWHELTLSSVYLAFEIFSFAASKVAVKEAATNKALTLMNAHLASTRSLLTDSIRHGERLEISRDLHDICGHQLTALILNLEFAAQQTANSNDDSSHATLIQSRDLAKALLSEIRNMVRSIRNDGDIDIKTALNEIADRLPGYNFAVNIDNALQIHSHKQAECILRVCQEAITNAIKHSQFKHIEVRLSQTNKMLALDIINQQSQQSDLNFGCGLNSIKERVSEYQGCMEIKQTPERFCLHVTLPLKDTL
ncbi:GHKL domain-containing protein [Pseudoalteromonas sp. SR44-8]|uniref:sensor histidine kinase n=1 Tax=Pseudoalteromonas sp. SR44-8 TaxID=2760933 RepID=UPI0016003D01|nr:histidine kinase [Pseudoalteromonas sp. SR44-8]MBB1302890.1 GHKL domain-containing protein [Pseudoalteromonas sp. SR44-8]